MSYNNTGRLIWTNHALERLHDRRISKNDAEATYRSPSHVQSGKQTGTTEFIRRFDGYTITIIGKKNDHNEWVAVSLWRDPPLYGTKDYAKKQEYHRYRKSGFWGKVWYTIKRQLFG
jgi:hypothetical protein